MYHFLLFILDPTFMDLLQDIILNIDLAPTFIDLATSTQTSTSMDGQSFKSVLLSTDPKSPPGWRTEFLVEHNGEVAETIPGCPRLNNQHVSVSGSVY